MRQRVDDSRVVLAARERPSDHQIHPWRVTFEKSRRSRRNGAAHAPNTHRVWC